MQNINESFIKSCDKLIGELAFIDMVNHKKTLSKAKQRNWEVIIVVKF